MSHISVAGFPPEEISYCPECGAEHFPHTTYYSDGRMKCDKCGLVCYIVEADDSHREVES